MLLFAQAFPEQAVMIISPFDQGLNFPSQSILPLLAYQTIVAPIWSPSEFLAIPIICRDLSAGTPPEPED